jgi:DNA-binding HxlR family transcriptional regulator
LWALHESGLVPMRALSQLLGISPRMVTGLVDALEADGSVTRSPHIADRRATIISLTPAAKRSMPTTHGRVHVTRVPYSRKEQQPARTAGHKHVEGRGQHRGLGKPRRAIT